MSEGHGEMSQHAGPAPWAPPAARPAPGPGRGSWQAKLVASGIATRVRVDVYDDALVITGALLPRWWRLAVQIALLACVVVMVVDVMLVRPLWSPQAFAVLAAAVLAFLVVVLAAGRPARLVSLVVPLSQVSCQSPAATVGSFGGKQKNVTLFGPFGGDWSTDGRIRLAFSSVADAGGLIASLSPASTPPFGPASMR